MFLSLVSLAPNPKQAFQTLFLLFLHPFYWMLQVRFWWRGLSFGGPQSVVISKTFSPEEPAIASVRVMSPC